MKHPPSPKPQPPPAKKHTNNNKETTKKNLKDFLPSQIYFLKFTKLHIFLVLLDLEIYHLYLKYCVEQAISI